MLNKFVAAFATLLLAAGLSVVAVAAPASATAYPPTGSSANQPENWQVLPGEVCYKIEPVNPVPYPLPSPGADRSFSKVIVKAGSGDDANYVISSGLAQGTLVQHNIKDSISHLVLCTTPNPTPPFDWNWTYPAPTCEALTVTYPANIPAGQANDVNVRIKYGANFSSEVTLNFHNNGGTWSGTTTFEYDTHPNWPANIGPYKVVWTQVGGTNYHWQGEVTCGSTPLDATATVTTNPPSCAAAETFGSATVVNATYVVTYPTATTYKVTATANAGHLFANGTTTLVIEGTLAPKTTEGCSPPVLKCLPKSAVSYTYLPATNNGVVTVVNPDPTKYTNDLCAGFWVTATSWHFTSTGLWPQVLYQNNPLAKITSVGTYPYAAQVLCGQGDIYASFAGSPYVGPELFGPNNPFSENFLSEMGFSGPSPTFMTTAYGCNNAPVTVPTAKAITECGTYGSVSVPADTEKVDYTLVGDGKTGINTVTAVAISPYVLKDYPAGGWSFNLGTYTDCERTLTLTYVPACAPDETNDWKVYNPGAENIEASYPGGTVTAIAGQYTTITTPASDALFTITWGATGSGIKPGQASATPGDDLPADDPACIKLAEPVAPTLTKVTECGVYGSVVPVPRDGVVYDVAFDKVTGDYKVTATPAFGYHFANDVPEIVFEGNVKAFFECIEEPDASVAYGECVYNEDGSADQRHVWITFDNTGSNKPVLFQVPYFPEYDQWVPAGEKVEFQVADIWPAGGGYQVKAAGETFELTIDKCDLPTLPDPIKRDDAVPTFDCSTGVATITTTTYTTNWKFDTEKLEWVKLPEVASAPVVTTRPMTKEEIGDEVCKVAVTDPAASTCLVQSDDTEFSSWIRIALDPNVEYRIDGVLATTEYVQVSAGQHTVTADALNGYTLTGGNPTAWTDTHHEWTFVAVDFATECQPEITGSTAAGVCEANAPWIYFDITVSDPANLVTDKDTRVAQLIMAGGGQTATVDLSTLTEVPDPNDPTKTIWVANGKVLWPGAAVGPDGVTPTAWPGWEQTPEGEWVPTSENFGWTRDVTQVTLKYNPEVVVDLTYPDATPDCYTSPEPPTLATVTPQFSSEPLTCTSAGSYTLGELSENTIQWTVNGKPVGVGTYQVTSPQTLTLIATPIAKTDGLDPDWEQPAPITFSAGSEPCDTTALAMTGAAGSFGLIWVGLLLALTGVGFFLLRNRRTETE